jgi:DNA repair protein RadD
MQLREYQTRTVSDLFAWWTKHQNNDDVPLLVLPTAAGKSIICAEIVRQMYEQWPDWHPRTVVLVPSKELAEQNAEKLVKLLPPHIKVGFVSASMGKKQHNADVIVATIGSIAKSAHLLGNIKCVLIDEAHLVNSKDEGMFRRFLNDLGKLCNFRTAGMTATPFRGNGVWLTDGDAPLFTGIASNVTMRELLDAKFIAPLVPPTDAVSTKIDASNVGISNGDYKIGELSDVVEAYLTDVAAESVRLASERSKWIAFTPTVANAKSLANKLRLLGIDTAIVTGETPKAEREALIQSFRIGDIRCLITVMALSTGFDVPDVDCLIWCRPTKSPVLYVQGFGRGVRIANGKTDCLVLDFTDTVARMGPIDTIKGRAKSKSGTSEAPFVVCDACGARNHAAAFVCAECGATIREPEQERKEAHVSRAAILSTQQPSTVVWHDITRVAYSVHSKPGKPDSLRVDYWSGLRCVASSWQCFDHEGYARQKAEQWFRLVRPDGSTVMPKSTHELMDWIALGFEPKEPTRIATRLNGKFTEVVSHEFARTESNPRSPEKVAA